MDSARHVIRNHFAQEMRVYSVVDDAASTVHHSLHGGTTSDSLPALRDHLWLSPPEAERAAQTLGPLFSKVRRRHLDPPDQTR